MASPRRTSITLRLTLLFASASTVVLLLLGALVGRAVEQHFEDEDREILAGKLALAQRAVDKAHTDADLDTLPQRLDDALSGHPGLALVVSVNGRTLFATSGADFPEALLASPAEAAEGGRPLVWTTRRGQTLRGIRTRIPSALDGAPPAVIGAATDIAHHLHFMHGFRVTLWSFVALAALLTGVLGWIAARRGLRPLHAIRRQAADITARRLDARLPADAVPVELDDLVTTLNAMLDRLQTSFNQLTDFSSDIAHELRTPVSNLLTQTQVSLSRERSADDYRDILASNAEELERLARMISDMLFLARAEHQDGLPTREAVDLADEVDALFEFYSALAEDRAIVLGRTGSGVVEGDRLMLRRALSNLLSNAIRHTPDGGRVDVALAPCAAERLRLTVANPGTPIPAEHLPRLFDRFYRVDPARHRQGDGTGLGLAITRSIVRAHGGEIAVHSDAGGTVFSIELPASPR